MSIGQNIKRYRENLSMTEEQFAEKVGITVQECRFIEAGRRALSSAEIQKIGEVLNVTFDDLLSSRPIPPAIPKRPPVPTPAADDEMPEEGSVLMPMDELKNLLGKMKE